jgi:hypothetical protein
LKKQVKTQRHSALHYIPHCSGFLFFEITTQQGIFCGKIENFPTKNTPEFGRREKMKFFLSFQNPPK